MKDKLLRLVGFSRQRHSVRDEVIGGLTTFLTMAYILTLNPKLYAPLAEMGMPVEGIFSATALAAVAGSLFMAFIARMPFGAAPGLTLNIFFVNTLCLTLGYPWQFALTAVLIEGLLFIGICLSGLRDVVFNILPKSLKYGISVGIGLFIAAIGMRGSGLIDSGDTIFGHIEQLTRPETITFMFGLLLTGLLSILHVRGALLIGIIVTTLVGIPLGVTHLPPIDNIFTMPISPAPLMLQFDWQDVLSPDMFVCVIIMLFFDIFDTLGTTVGVLTHAGMTRSDGRIPHLSRIMLGDSMGTVAGACLGTSTVTTYVESATGVAQGGRTGMTALVVAICFLVSLFIAPLFLAIPTEATSPVLVIAGFYLFSSVRHIDTNKILTAIPAFLAILLMPITGSISDGILISIAAYAFISFVDGWVHRKRNKEAEDDEASTTICQANIANS